MTVNQEERAGAGAAGGPKRLHRQDLLLNLASCVVAFLILKTGVEAFAQMPWAHVLVDRAKTWQSTLADPRRGSRVNLGALTPLGPRRTLAAADGQRPTPLCVASICGT